MEYFASSCGFALHEETWMGNQLVRWLSKRKKSRNAPHHLDTGIRPKRYREPVRSLSGIAVRHEVTEEKQIRD